MPSRSPSPDQAHIIHYGLDCDVGEHFHFTKKRAHSATSCEGQLFGDPPRPTHQERLCAETVWTINDALCDHYARPQPQPPPPPPNPHRALTLGRCDYYARPEAQGLRHTPHVPRVAASPHQPAMRGRRRA